MKKFIKNPSLICAGPASILLIALVTMVPTRAAAEDDYFPLASGMEWIMDFQIVSPNGDTTNGVLHRKFGEPVQHDGKTYLRSHTWLEAGRPVPMDHTKLVRRDAAG